VAGIYGMEGENVAEEGAVRLGVFGVDDYVSPRNHAVLQEKPREFGRCEFSGNCKIQSISSKLGF
jgi:hypothetical protein